MVVKRHKSIKVSGLIIQVNRSIIADKSLSKNRVMKTKC